MFSVIDMLYSGVCFIMFSLLTTNKARDYGMMREVNVVRGSMLWLGTVNFMNVFGTASGIPSKYYLLRTNSILMLEHLERQNLIWSGASLLV
jgi:hypothetical protein